jgi:hypothetical protein
MVSLVQKENKGANDMHYSVNDKTFSSYLDAVKEAQTYDTVVILIATGQVKWKPLPPVSQKRMNRYLNQKAAHEAYLKSLN